MSSTALVIDPSVLGRLAKRWKKAAKKALPETAQALNQCADDLRASAQKVRRPKFG